MISLSTPLRIRSLGGFHAVVDPMHGPASLADILSVECSARFRRIDRFTQLALIGSGRCMKNQPPDSNTGLYIGSRFASLSNTIRVQEKMVKEGGIPKPAHFINTLSNSAGYHVARHLGLSGRNLFASRNEASLMAALQLAQLDLAGGVVSRALIGVVDEAAMPVRDHCRRLGVPAGTPLGEGSQWFLVSQDDDSAGLGALTALATLPDADMLEEWVAGITQEFACAARVWWPEHLVGLPPPVADLTRFRSGLACGSAAVGGAINAYLSEGHSEPLLMLVADGEARYHGMVYQPGPSPAV